MNRAAATGLESLLPVTQAVDDLRSMACGSQRAQERSSRGGCLSVRYVVP
jgi:hypothetical protein